MAHGFLRSKQGHGVLWRGPVAVRGHPYSRPVADSKPTAGKKEHTQGKGGHKLGSPEWVKWMSERRAAAIAERGDAARGGTKKKPTAKEARERELEKLVPEAVKVLERQMRGEHVTVMCPHCEEQVLVVVPDEKIAQNAAVKILEWGKGKPRQTIENVGEQVQVIRYETAALGEWS